MAPTLQPGRRLAVASTIFAILGVPIVLALGVLAMFAASETQEWNLQWAERIQVAFLVATLVWVATIVGTVAQWSRVRRRPEA